MTLLLKLHILVGAISSRLLENWVQNKVIQIYIIVSTYSDNRNSST